MKAQEILTTIRYAVAIPSVWQLGHSLRPVSHELAAIMESLQMAAKGQISLTALPGFILADCGQYDLAGKWDLITGLTGDESED